MGDGTADAGIAERRPLDVEAQALRAERGPDRRFALQPGVGLGGATASGRDVGHVQLPGHVFVVARDLGRDDAEHHAVEERRTAEVLREALQDHLVVATPRDEPKGARADRVTGEAGAAPVDLLTRDDRGGVVCDQGKEGCERLIEVKLHREIVDDAYSRDVARVARDEGACAGDLLDHPGPLALGGPLERVLHVGRCERAAVVEANAIPQQERVDARIGRRGPASCQGGNDAEGLVELEERVENLSDHGRGRQVGVGQARAG